MSAPEPKLPQDEIAGFANGACLDLRLRFAMQLLSSGGISVLPASDLGSDPFAYAKNVARTALDISTALIDLGFERGLIDPIGDGDLDPATIAHGERVGAFQAAQQLGGQKAMQAAQSPVATLRRPGMNG